MLHKEDMLLWRLLEGMRIMKCYSDLHIMRWFFHFGAACEENECTLDSIVDKVPSRGDK